MHREQHLVLFFSPHAQRVRCDVILALQSLRQEDCEFEASMEGRKETRAEMFRAHVLKLNKKGMDAEKIADLLEETPEEVRRQGIGG